MNKENKGSKTFDAPIDTPVDSKELKELYRRLEPSMRRQKPGPDALAAALESAQRLAAEAEAEDAAADTAADLTADVGTIVCAVCGYHNREGNKFCAMCGVAAGEKAPRAATSEAGRPGTAMTLAPNQSPPNQSPEHLGRPATTQPTGYETHHYHHHYHHHYFPGGMETGYPRAGAEPVREEKLRPNVAMRGEMSRAEAAVRAVTQEWVMACNTKHLDDLLELYVSDALVLRSNYPPIRGAAAVREFFFGALDAGLGEVELEPLRMEIAGDFAYEAGRCKALIPSSTGKRREERGKYLWVCARQSNGEWKLAADCWSSDLTLATLEADVPANIAVKTGAPRK